MNDFREWRGENQEDDAILRAVAGNDFPVHSSGRWYFIAAVVLGTCTFGATYYWWFA